MSNTVTYTNEFMQYFSTLFDRVKEYTFFGYFIRDELSANGIIIGINAFSASYVRKEIIMEEIENEIRANRLPLEISNPNPMDRQFKIYLKKDV